MGSSAESISLERYACAAAIERVVMYIITASLNRSLGALRAAPELTFL